jgi:hypothetical protein
MINIKDIMKLDKFVTETINAIVIGVKKSQDHAKKNDATINPKIAVNSVNHNDIKFKNPKIQCVEFDIAITAQEGKGNKNGIGVYVGPVGLGTQGTSETSNSSISRVKFTVPVMLPSQQEE